METGIILKNATDSFEASWPELRCPGCGDSLKSSFTSFIPPNPTCKLVVVQVRVRCGCGYTDILQFSRDYTANGVVNANLPTRDRLQEILVRCDKHDVAIKNATAVVVLD